MFERFTQQARAIVERARFEARALNHAEIGTPHMLLALLSGEQNVARAALEQSGADAATLRTQILDRLGSGVTEAGKKIPFSAAAKHALEAGLRAAMQLGQSFIGTEHLLLGMLTDEEFVIAVLRENDVDLDALGNHLSVTATMAELVVREAAGEGASAARETLSQLIEGALAPKCPTCNAALEETAAFRRLQVPEENGEGTAEFRVVFCRACGKAIMGAM